MKSTIRFGRLFTLLHHACACLQKMTHFVSFEISLSGRCTKNTRECLVRNMCDVVREIKK